VGWGCGWVWSCGEVGGGICWVWDGDFSPDLSKLSGFVFSDSGLVPKLLTVVPPTTCWALTAL